jgi:predicted dehydrogenase
LGTLGGLRLNPFTVVTNMGRYQVDVTPQVPAMPNIPFYGHWKAAAHMVRVLDGQEPLLVQPAEVLNVIRALEALYQSADKGREIRLD